MLTKRPGQRILSDTIAVTRSLPAAELGPWQRQRLARMFDLVRAIGSQLVASESPDGASVEEWRLNTPPGITLTARQVVARDGAALMSLCRTQPVDGASAVDVLVFDGSEDSRSIEWIVGTVPQGSDPTNLVRGGMRHARPVRATPDAVGRFAVELDDLLDQHLGFIDSM